MEDSKVGFLLFSLWSIGVIGINVYLTSILNSVRISFRSYLINFMADIGVSAISGCITWLLAKALHAPDIYLVMIAAVIGHLSARVAYQSAVLDSFRKHPSHEHLGLPDTAGDLDVVEPPKDQDKLL